VSSKIRSSQSTHFSTSPSSYSLFPSLSSSSSGIPPKSLSCEIIGFLSKSEPKPSGPVLRALRCRGNDAAGKEGNDRITGEKRRGIGFEGRWTRGSGLDMEAMAVPMLCLLFATALNFQFQHMLILSS
jgi:hypothetical protein